ncbi:LysR family transcriptional regulator substrate-binding protein [Streptomyces sp. NPDC017988]|uniref:LysR family transcriptional regulator substrate-binding protein n=1 Tax=Streptomyces sp. NPDC017988 TaxID=3365025 RepID=UPI00378D15D2
MQGHAAAHERAEETGEERDSAEVAQWLENGTADAAILIDPPPGPGVQLALDGYRALLPRDHPLAGATSCCCRWSPGPRAAWS